MSDKGTPKDDLTAIEEDLESAMARLNTANTRIDDLLAGLEADQGVEDAGDSEQEEGPGPKTSGDAAAAD